MDKICLIKQPAGIGDIFLCQKIAKTIQRETVYKKVIWPVLPIYEYIKDYINSKDITFCSVNDNFEYKDIYLSSQMNILKTSNYLYVPLETANYVRRFCKCHNSATAVCMMKYDFCGISRCDWVSYFEFTRNIDRENDLIKKLDVDISAPYNLINKNYGSFPNFLTRNDIIPKNNFRNVYIDFYDNVNLFDWVGVIENATEIHTVETSVAYILEKLKLKNVFLYSKIGSSADFECIKEQFNKSWAFIK